MHATKGEKVFQGINYGLLAVVSLICLFPMIHIIALSFSHSAYVAANMVTFWPVKPHILNYKFIFEHTSMVTNMMMSIQRVLVGTAVNIFLVLITAYPLSYDGTELKGRNTLMWILVVPMFLHAGLIPNYILISRLGLMDSLWALILPGAVTIWNIIMMQNFFRSMPRELHEAALIDGAGHLTVLFRILVPLNLAAIATLSLFCAVNHWNAWFDGMIYIRHPQKMPVQTALRSLMKVTAHIVGQERFYTPEELAMLSDRSLTCAKIAFTTLPILVIYPFVQRFFVKGVIIGAVKG